MTPRLETPEEIAALLNARPAGEGRWSARCPAHDDSTASLSIGTGGDGKVLLHCHAGCSFDAIAAALNGAHGSVAGPRPRFGGLAATYEYHDESGAVLFEVQRDVDKNFRVRRPNVGCDPGEPRWTYNLGDVRRVLYRLPEVLVAVHHKHRIYVVEGEKDADSIAKLLGLTATTNPGGAGKWRAEQTEALKGAREIVILPDNDEPGRKHGRTVAEALRPVVETVRVLELPGLAEKGDVSDWIAAGGNRDALERLADGAAAYTPAPPSQSVKAATARLVDGHEIAFRELDPWPDPVIGAELLDEIVLTFRRFLKLPEGAAEAMALWAVFAHAHDCFPTSPLLAFTSPAKRCGKTTALQIIVEIVPRPLPAANVTPAAVFRSIEKYNPTLLIDEADTFLGEKDELRGMLNSGHSRRSAYLIRTVTVGDHHEVRRFSTWCPKAVALIGKLHETLEDRSIVISMKRRARGEKLERLRGDRLGELEHLARKAATWAASMIPAFRAADPEVPEALDDRAADNWRPLLSVADAAGVDWPERARKAAAILSAGRDDDEGSVSTDLLTDVRTVFEDRKVDRLPSKALAEALKGLEDSRWSDWSHGRGLSPNGLARLLAPFGIGPKKIRFPEGPLKGYERAAFKDAFVRYLPGGAVEQEHRNNPRQEREIGLFEPEHEPEHNVPRTGTEAESGDGGDDGPLDDPTGTGTATGTGFSAPVSQCSVFRSKTGAAGEGSEAIDAPDRDEGGGRSESGAEGSQL